MLAGAGGVTVFEEFRLVWAIASLFCPCGRELGCIAGPGARCANRPQFADPPRPLAIKPRATIVIEVF